MRKLLNNLTGNVENHIFPFLWLHGESEEILREYIGKIKESGIQSFCIEARPHPEFVKNQWWNDLDIILDEAKKLNMKIWILDDSHFPTGFANGAIQERYPQYRKRFLKLHQFDFAGPMKYAQALIKYAFTDEEDRLEGVYLAKKLDYEKIDVSTLVDISNYVKNNETVSFELPEGEWKVLVMVSTFKGGEKQTEGYLNPIVPEATDILLKEVYEPHFEHYKEEFGKTIKGFFSDEPRFGNMHGPYGSIGRESMVLPWRDDMAEILTERIKKVQGKETITEEEVKKFCTLLFVDGQEEAHQMRYFYMDTVSELYAEHFSKRLGDWCHAHGVAHIGHTIEDNNAHARLGYGAGHFFRAMRGQDMAGIDVVLHQLMPGMDHVYNKAMTGKGWDGEFFHYCLGKLGTSLGHITPEMKGRTMCEVFGAYGWAEGNRLMKWIADYMLVRGVNEFVPHAFDPKEYPDMDCPPHFYAHGKNPQFQDFKMLMKYMNRISTLLSDGIHRAPVAVGYHGEAEWSGEYMLMQKPCAVLCRNQIDYDIIPPETIVQAKTKSGNLIINQEAYKALVIPYSEALPYEYLEKIVAIVEKGIKVYFIDKLPVRSSEGLNIDAIYKSLENNSNVKQVSVEYLVENLRQDKVAEIETFDYEPYLRYYHYEQEDGNIFMFTNEGVAGKISTEVQFPEKFAKAKACYQYDAFTNEIRKMKCYSPLHLELDPYESVVYCFINEEKDIEKIENDRKVQCVGVEHYQDLDREETEIGGPFKISFKKAGAETYADEMVIDKLCPLQLIDGKEDFCGVICYEADFEVNEVSEKTEIILEKVYEGARVSVNGEEEKVRICPPYCYDVTDAIKKGTNHLRVEVTTTLVRAQKDWLSQFVLLEPTGITEKIVLRKIG